jgi:hypothetical protein
LKESYKGRLAERLSNRQFRTELNKIIKVSAEAAATGYELTGYKQCCTCGCGLLVAPGCKFVNQDHYDRARLPQVKAEQIIADFRQGVPKRQLARDHGIALSTVKRLLRKHELVRLPRSERTILGLPDGSARALS